MSAITAVSISHDPADMAAADAAASELVSQIYAQDPFSLLHGWEHDPAERTYTISVPLSPEVHDSLLLWALPAHLVGQPVPDPFAALSFAVCNRLGVDRDTTRVWTERSPGSGRYYVHATYKAGGHV